MSQITILKNMAITQRHHGIVTLSESRAFCPEGMPLARMSRSVE
jgi:hypothetical protein